MKHRVLIFIYLGGSILHFVKCYSSGYFDDTLGICQTMEVWHETSSSSSSIYLPQDSEPPFIVDPDNVVVVSSDVGKLIEVTLKADSHERFIGFMLEARKPDDSAPQGIFSLLNPSLSRLQRCGGIDGKAVTQTNNQDKSEIKVEWTASEPGVYFFRATFVKDYATFWYLTPAPTSTPDPVTTTITISASTTLSSDTAAAPPQPYLLGWSLTLSLLSYFFLAECGPYLARVHICAWMKVTSFMSLAFSFAAFILLLIDTKQVEGKILAGVAASLNFCQTILIFFLCGPSHELRKIFCWVLRVVGFMNVCFTIATIYFGLVENCFKNTCFWPTILMGIYLACHLLSYPFFLYGALKQKHRPQTASKKQNCRVSCWCTCLVIFSGMNIAFTIALVLGIFLCYCEIATVMSQSP